MYSAEGEEVKLSFSIYPSNNVEDWLLEVERSMKASVHDIIEQAIKAYPTVSAALLLGWGGSVLPQQQRLHLQPTPSTPQEAQCFSSCCLAEKTLAPAEKAKAPGYGKASVRASEQGGGGGRK